MGESPSADIQDVWQIYQNTKARYDATAALYDLVSGVAAGIIAVTPGSANDDYLSFARSGMIGGEPYSRESLLQRMSELAKQMTDLDSLMEKQHLRAVKYRAGHGARRVGRGGVFWRGW